MTAEVANYYAFERLAKSIAQRLIKRHESFRGHPTPDGYGGTMIGWLRNFGRKGVSQGASTMMLVEDLDEAMLALRPRLLSIGEDRIGPARAAVLAYLAMLPELGVDRVLSWTPMWDALRDGRWNDAADALLMTEWPAVMAGSRQNVIRGVALQRVIRTGNQFTDDDERRIASFGAPN